MKKNKILMIITSCSLIFTFLCSTIACGGKNIEQGQSSYEEVSAPNLTEKVFEKVGINLIEAQRTEYKIVIPEGGDTISSFAASEATEFLRLSTGVKLDTINDSGLTFNSEVKYISLGETALLDGAGITVDKETLGESGYILRTVGNCLFVASVTAPTYNGTIYGVYDMLKYLIGLEIYAADEIVYDTLDIVPLYKFNETFRPSIDIRCLAFKKISSDKSLAYRMRLIGQNSDVWSSFTHTLISDYLPYSTYGAMHPDWYVNGNQQLCMTNEEMIQELILQVEDRLTKYPDTTMVMLGHEDNNAVCHCDRCTSVEKEYGEYSGIELELTNKVAKAVDKWLETAYPDRKVFYAFFAYGPTLNAPVSYDAETDSYSLNNPDTEILDNVGVFIAPIAMNFSRSPSNAENQASYRSLKSWSYLFKGKNIFIWNYCLNAYSYFFQYNNFGVVQEYYKLYSELGTSYIFDQGYYDSNICTFEDLRIYVQSQLMYNTTLQYEELADKFINQYYGAGADAIKKYYNLIRSHYYALEQTNSASGTIFFLLDDKKLWPIGLVNTMLDELDEAISAIEPLKSVDPERYNTLYFRIQKERLSPIYMMMQYYVDLLSDDVKASYIADFEKYTKYFEIEASREGSFNVSSLIEDWKKL